MQKHALVLFAAFAVAAPKPVALDSIKPTWTPNIIPIHRLPGILSRSVKPVTTVTNDEQSAPTAAPNVVPSPVPTYIIQSGAHVVINNGKANTEQTLDTVGVASPTSANTANVETTVKGFQNAIPTPRPSTGSPYSDMVDENDKKLREDFIAAYPGQGATHAEANARVDRHSPAECMSPVRTDMKLDLDPTCLFLVASLTPDQRLTWIKGMMPGNLCPVDRVDWETMYVDTNVHMWCNELGDQLEAIVIEAEQPHAGFKYPDTFYTEGGS